MKVGIKNLSFRGFSSAPSRGFTSFRAEYAFDGRWIGLVRPFYRTFSAGDKEFNLSDTLRGRPYTSNCGQSFTLLAKTELTAASPPGVNNLTMASIDSADVEASIKVALGLTACAQ